MTLHDTMLQLIGYAEADQLDRQVFGELFGGRVTAAGKTGGKAVVAITYPGWELAMRYDKGKVAVSIGPVPALFLANGLNSVVNVAEYPITGEAFARVLKAALEAMEEGGRWP
jgi:hypothetical protein